MSEQELYRKAVVAIASLAARFEAARSADEAAQLGALAISIAMTTLRLPHS